MSVHTPVMLTPVLAHLSPKDGETYVDATFGAGGYTSALLSAANCSVIAFDQDPDAIARGDAVKAAFPGRLTLVMCRFGDMVTVLNDLDAGKIDGVVFDLGVSSPQLDEAARGFSFREDGPLDMRMAQSGPSAQEYVNSLDETALADIIYKLGDERRSRRVARAIVEARAQAPIETTGQLADIVRRVVPKAADGIDPATRTFMALRLHVNDELGELRRGLEAAEVCLRAGGRLVVVSFHSLEDRYVKNFLRDRSGTAPRASRHRPTMGSENAATFKLLSRQGVKPAKDEITSNPRARSARLRAAIRTDAPMVEAAA